MPNSRGEALTGQTTEITTTAIWRNDRWIVDDRAFMNGLSTPPSPLPTPPHTKFHA